MEKESLTLKYVLQEFSEIGKALSAERDTNKLLEKIIEKSLHLTCSDAGTIYIVVDETNREWSPAKKELLNGKTLKFAIVRNSSMQINLEAGLSRITHDSIYGYALLTDTSVIIDDVYKLSDHEPYTFNPAYDKSTGYRTKSILTVPLKDHEENMLGVIQLINKKLNSSELLNYKDRNIEEQILPYTSEDELIISSLSGQAAVALENSILYRNLNELLSDNKKQNVQLEDLSKRILRSHEDERKRIARDIHDGPAQSMANASFRLELCDKYQERNMIVEYNKEINSLKQIIKSSVKEIRSIIYNLKPDSLESGLLNALETHLTTFSESGDENVTFYSEGEDTAIEYYLSSTLFRVVQEACTNIRKHAAAQNVNVSIIIREKDILLTIVDDGKGFEMNSLNNNGRSKLEGGFGLEGMKERIELIRGELKFSSSKGKGTKIEVLAPNTIK